MSQHDFSIANQTASSARSDINNALQALASNNSGGSSPSTTYANMLWYNTTSNILYLRNEGNTAWIEVANVDQGAGRFEPVNAVPVAAVNTFAMSTAPSGWLSCSGTDVSRTTYSRLWDVVGTTYGSGDGSTTFTLPDLRGEFVRGFDAGRGVDSGRVFGSSQTDELKSHNHANSGFYNSGIGGSQLPIFTTNNGIPRTHYSNSTGGTETRPRNIALLYCIKY